jgi:hypothetical protein
MALIHCESTRIERWPTMETSNDNNRDWLRLSQRCLLLSPDVSRVL